VGEILLDIAGGATATGRGKADVIRHRGLCPAGFCSEWTSKSSVVCVDSSKQIDSKRCGWVVWSVRRNVMMRQVEARQ
jgi:hypothetical protein